jgi:hypothetical protein
MQHAICAKQGGAAELEGDERLARHGSIRPDLAGQGATEDEFAGHE